MSVFGIEYKQIITPKGTFEGAVNKEGKLICITKYNEQYSSLIREIIYHKGIFSGRENVKIDGKWVTVTYDDDGNMINFCPSISWETFIIDPNKVPKVFDDPFK